MNNNQSNGNAIASSFCSLSINDSPLRNQPNFVDLSSTDNSLTQNNLQNDNQILNNSSILNCCVGARVMRGIDWQWSRLFLI